MKKETIKILASLEKYHGTDFLRMVENTLEDCGICGMEHQKGFKGDCRDNANRYPKADVIA